MSPENGDFLILPVQSVAILQHPKIRSHFQRKVMDNSPGTENEIRKGDSV